MHQRIKIMNCENCKYYERHYAYSKNHGFVYLHSGGCSKNSHNNPDDCYFFEEEHGEIVKKENLSLENLIMEMCIKCEEMKNQLAELLEEYKEKGKIGYIKQNNKLDNTKIIFR